MGADVPPGESSAKVEAELGRRVWGPPAEIEERAARLAKGDRTKAMLLYAAALAAVVAAAVTATPGNYGSSTGLSATGGLIALAATWLLYRAGRHEAVSLGVFEKGVLMPGSFESMPGLATMGGPVFIRRADVDRAEDMRSGDERAVVVWSKAGRSGLLSARGSGGLDNKLLDDFAAALASAGWAPRDAGPPDRKEDE